MDFDRNKDYVIDGEALNEFQKLIAETVMLRDENKLLKNRIARIEEDKPIRVTSEQLFKMQLNGGVYE